MFACTAAARGRLHASRSCSIRSWSPSPSPSRPSPRGWPPSSRWCSPSASRTCPSATPIIRKPDCGRDARLRADHLFGQDRHPHPEQDDRRRSLRHRREAARCPRMALCSDAELDESGDAMGEPTEAALVALRRISSALRQDARSRRRSPALRRGSVRLHAQDDEHRPCKRQRLSSSTPRARPTCLSASCAYCIDSDGRRVAHDRRVPRRDPRARTRPWPTSALRVLALRRARLGRKARRTTSRRLLSRSSAFMGLTRHDRPRPPRGRRTPSRSAARRASAPS